MKQSYIMKQWLLNPAKNHIKVGVLLALLLLTAGVAWGATVYVKPGAANPTTATQHKSSASSCDDAAGWTDGSDLEAAIAAAGVSGTLYICPGTYSGTMIDAADGLDTSVNNLTIRSVGAVTLDFRGIADIGINFNTSGVSLSGESPSNKIVIMAEPGRWPIHGGLGNTVRDAIIYGTTAGGMYSSNLVELTRVEILNTPAPGIPLQIAGGSTTVLNYCKIAGNNKDQPTIDISNTTASSAATINHLLSTDNAGVAVRLRTTSPTAVTINNPIFFGNGTYVGTTHTVSNESSAGGTVVINNPIAHGNTFDADDYNFLNCTLNNAIRDKDPLFVSNKYPSKLAIIIDDTANLDWALDTIAPKLAGYGFAGVFSVNTTHTLTQDQIGKLGQLEALGWELACHSRHHIQLGAMSGPYTITRAATTAGLTGGVLSTSTPHSYTLSSYTFTTLKTALEADGYTVGAVATGYGDMPATTLADFAAGTSIAAGYALLMDATRTYTEEVLNSKNDLIAAGFTPRTFIPPGNSTSVGLRTYLSGTAGFDGARGGGTTGITLSSFNIYDIGFRDLTSTIGDYDACVTAGETQANCIKRNVVAWLGKMAVQGILYTFYTHGESEWDSDEWDALLAAISQSKITVTTLSGLVDYAKSYDPSGDLATADDMLYTRTMVDLSNYRLRANSPAIDAGTPIFTAAAYPGDLAGNMFIYGTAPDIGAYEKKKFLFEPFVFVPKKCKTTNAACYVQD